MPNLARADALGLGLIIGDTTGISMKYYLHRHLALDAALGAPWGYAVGPGVALHGDVMYTAEMVKVRKGKLFFHLGGGVGMAFGSAPDDFEMGLRFTTGAEYFFHQSPFSVFGELVPVLIFVSPGGMRLHAAFGGRYYF